MEIQTDLNPIEALLRDVKNAARTLSDTEARFLVDYYYIIQEDRKRGYNQERSLDEAGEPSAVIGWFATQSKKLEAQLKIVLDAYTTAHPMGSWMRQIHGIGPVISAGLLAHIDIEKAPTVGHIWRFAGLDPTVKWEKGQKRPWNAKLKVLCWKAGQSFMKMKGSPNCFYGHVYEKRKELEVERNESGGNAKTAAELLPKFKTTTEAYKYLSAGKLPPAQIDARARRYAVKLFLSHLHGAWYEMHYKKPAPLPYPIQHLGHVHFIKSPV